MARVYECDQCDELMDSPTIVVQHEVTETDDEGDDFTYDDEAHFCTIKCLASWAMTEALTAGVQAE
jgi:hypothetical protein